MPSDKAKAEQGADGDLRRVQQADINRERGLADGRRGRASPAVHGVQRVCERRMASAGIRRDARVPPRVAKVLRTKRSPTMSESAAPIAQIVETMRALAGPHPGFRPVHAKGLVCHGTFRGASPARGVSRAPHLQGEVVPTVIRFSNAGGNPDVHDGQPSPRAMAVKFQLPDGKNADILGLSIEGFPARTPEDFLAFLQAQLPTRQPDSLGPTRCPAFWRSIRPLRRSSGA